MNSTTMIKQFMDFHKKAFDDSFNAFITVRENADKILRVFLESSALIPEESKKVLSDWLSDCKTGLDDCQRGIHNHFNLLEKHILSIANRMDAQLEPIYAKQEPDVPADTKEAKPRKPAAKGNKVRSKKSR